jgi:DNA-directed RNA polymerase specialized sigma24 family protein
MPDETNETDQLLERASQGDPGSWHALLGQSRQRLHRMVAFRLDQRLQGRVDPSDVLQDAYLEAWQDLGTYMRQPAMPFFLWLRGIAGNKLRELQRHHLGTKMRDPRREVPIYGGSLAETTTAAERKREAELGRSFLGQARAVRYSGQPARRSDALAILGPAARIVHAVDDSAEHLAELRDEVIRRCRRRAARLAAGPSK